ncbi:MAG: grasp-with-spasm system ATP-grasp peptide maturase [Prevotellaceae bacterium]|nr:grasp-with-spasm system ATP-grasp peptide maturase [Prevotellaceae bacterium]
MVLIMSENNDITTDRVIEWLYFFGVTDIVRINKGDKIIIEKIDIQNNTIILKTKDKEIDLRDIAFFWYRRGLLTHFTEKEIVFEDADLNRQANRFLNFEWHICRDFILYSLQQKKSLGNFFKSEANKPVNLRIAKECGLEIPESIISESIALLKNFQNNGPVITKPIGEALSLGYKEGNYRIFTTEVKKEFFTDEKTIFPTLLQKKIEKQFEIRAFVMYEKIYAMAIFSQRNSKTNIDYRNYDFEKKNRMIPYILPLALQEKILNFMQKTGLDTGSFDFIKTPDNRYVFLEVNPVGVIDMVSSHCNYNIEKEIAEMIKNKMCI